MLFYQQLFKIIHCKNGLISQNAVKFVNKWKIGLMTYFKKSLWEKSLLSTELLASVGEVVIFFVVKKQLSHCPEKK